MSDGDLVLKRNSINRDVAARDMNRFEILHELIRCRNLCSDRPRGGVQETRRCAYFGRSTVRTINTRSRIVSLTCEWLI